MNAAKWRVLSCVMLGSFMSPLEGAIANVAVAPIARSFGVSIGVGVWVLLGYLLALASLLALFGRLGDMIGHKRVYVIGFGVFGVASLASALAPNFALLVAARVLQGVGSAMVQSCTSAILTAAFPPSERGRALGINGASVAAGLTAGPVIGGALVTFAGWRWIFLINAPISLVGMVWASRALREDRTRPERFDIAGAAIGTSALFGIALALSQADAWGPASPRTLGVLGLSIAGLVAFALVEARVREPIVDPALFRNRTFGFSVTAAFLHFTALYGLVFTIPLALQEGEHASAFAAGLAIAPITLAGIALAPVFGALSDRVAARILASIGAACVGAAALALALHTPTPATVLGVTVAVGFGIAMFNQPNNSTIMGSAPRDRLGIAAGILATARTSGILLGTALAGALYALAAARGTVGLAAGRTEFFVAAAIEAFVVAISLGRGTLGPAPARVYDPAGSP